MTRRPWLLYVALRVRWLPRPATQPRLKLHRRPCRGRRQYTRHGPRAYRWNRWYLERVEVGSGGPYSADWYHWRRLRRRRPAETCVYCVEW
jgi:hypothetical protein